MITEHSRVNIIERTQSRAVYIYTHDKFKIIKINKFNKEIHNKFKIIES